MKTNKFTRWTLLTAFCLTLTLALGACKDNDDAYDRPAVSVTQVDKTADGTTIIGSAEGTAKLRISSNRPWTATTALDWLSITPESGSAGDHEVTIRVLKNSTGATRQGQFAFRAGGQTIFYTIQQQSDGSSIINPGDKPSQPENPNQPSPGDITVDGTDLKNFIAKYDTGASVTITADEVFKAVVITDATGNNFVSNKNLVVQAGDSGIGIRLPQVVNTAWTSGTVLSINAKGGKVERYNDGSLQLNFATPPTITPTGERSTIVPKQVTLADVFAGKYDNVLVAVEGVQFDKPYAKLNNQTGAKPQTDFLKMTDCVTALPAGVDALAVAISGYSKFKGEPASDKNGRVIGIIQRSTNKDKTVKHYNLWPRTVADLAGLTGARCTGTPTPTPSGADLFISAYLEGIGLDKYLAIYNPTGAEVDLSAYSIELSVFAKDNNSGKAVERRTYTLTGKLAAGATVIFRRDGATVNQGYSDENISKVIDFNGNDPIALKKNGAVIDVLGSFPNIWLAADGKIGAGKDVLLHRKSSVSAPSATYDAGQWESVTTITKESKIADLLTQYFAKR